jgi:hypothetical protein
VLLKMYHSTGETQGVPDAILCLATSALVGCAVGSFPPDAVASALIFQPVHMCGLGCLVGNAGVDGGTVTDNEERCTAIEELRSCVGRAWCRWYHYSSLQSTSHPLGSNPVGSVVLMAPGQDISCG